MEVEERSEIREIIHGILSGWEAQTVAREELTNMALKNIDDHFIRLNGSVAKHESIINANLPHTIANCPQDKIIKEIHDAVIGEEAVKAALKIKEANDAIVAALKQTRSRDTWYKILTIIGLVCAIYFGIKNSHKITGTTNTLKQEIRDQEGVSKVTRGGYVPYTDAGLRDSIRVK